METFIFLIEWYHGWDTFVSLIKWYHGYDTFVFLIEWYHRYRYRYMAQYTILLPNNESSGN